MYVLLLTSIFLIYWADRIDAVKIEDVLKNATDRSAWIDFKGYMNATMRTDYFDECERFPFTY